MIDKVHHLPRFRLELHITYFQLRLEELHNTPTCHPGPWQRWTELCFLKPRAHVGTSSRYAIRETRETIVISGQFSSSWVGIGLSLGASGCATGDSGEEYDPDDELDEKDQDEWDVDADRQPDIFAPHDAFEHPLDGQIWDPREYYLRVVSTRIEMVCREWRYMIQEVECGIREQVSSTSISFAKSTC
jgi:hypothetical protein